MLIRHKLIVYFCILVAAILLLFSFAIYSFNSYGKEKLFRSRLKSKAISTALLFDDINSLNEIALQSLDNQYEIIYNEQNQKIHSIGKDNGFTPTTELLKSIKENKEVYFSSKDNIEGTGIYYTSQTKKIIVIVTAVNTFGNQRIQSLKNVLFIANFIGLLLTFIAAVIFSNQALMPINKFINQIRHLTGNELNDRLPEGDIKDEMTNLAIEFNKLINRLRITVDSHKNFVSNASNELRTPLATILGTLETSYAYDKDIESAKISIQSSIEELKRIIELTNGLLNLVKIENKEIQLIQEHTDLLEIILESINSNRKKYPNQKIELDVHKIDDEFSSYFIKGKKDLLIIAISNIIDNACKYSDNKTVHISLKIEGGKIQLSIIDEGCGISYFDHKKIFEPLYRGENSKNIPGFGIGLALVQRIIYLHEAHFELQSDLNKGTTIHLLFNPS